LPPPVFVARATGGAGVKLLFVGDLVGSPGRKIVRKLLPGLVDRHQVDFCVANVENAAGGFGITPDVMSELDGLPIDCFTSGNHIWDKKEGVALLDADDRILRPANYPDGNPGRGLYVGETPAGIPVAVMNLEGQVFMKALESPFRTADRLLATLPKKVKVVFVDFHAEATSEKLALGFHLDGRVSAVVGTHTHVPTADERILPKGTAFQCDVGMTGPYESIIGMQVERVLHRFLMHTPSSFEVAKRDVRLAATLVDVDEETGHARAIERLLIQDATV
jgi:metallophosphoesterase (TIGR00282 family)